MYSRAPLAKIGRSIINLSDIRNVHPPKQRPETNKWRVSIYWKDKTEYTFDRDTEAEAQAIFDSILAAASVEMIEEWA
jgi:hypothetical protein